MVDGTFQRLKDLRDRAFQGLRTSDNHVYVLRATGPSQKGLMPVLSSATGEVHHLEATLLKPLLSGEDIRAFSLQHQGQWILFPYDLSGPEPMRLSEKRLRSEYPAGWNYLKVCEARLRERERGKMDGPGWWAFGRNQNLDQFEQPKIMLPDYEDSPAAGLDLEGRFYSITAYCLTLKNTARITLPILACLLNSNLLFWVLAKTGTALQHGFVRFMPQYLDRLPIAQPDPNIARTLEDIAKRAMRSGYANVKAELNATVSRLYGLTEEEDRMIERVANHRIVPSVPS